MPKSTIHQATPELALINEAPNSSFEVPKPPSTAREAGYKGVNNELADASQAAFAFTPHMRA